MKKIFFAFSALLCLTALTVSCEKEPQCGNDTGSKVALSIKADASFAEDNTATVTLELSKAVSEDVTVTLSKASVQAGKTEVPADFSKTVKIAKGATSATVKVEADVLGLEAGEYQAAVQIADVKGNVEKPEIAVVYINLTYVYKPEVNIYAETSFASDKTAKIRVALAKETTKDVKVKLAPAADNKYTVVVEPAELTIAAGKLEASTVAKVTVPEDITIGVYPLAVNIESVENAVKGKVVSATINLTYPLPVNITIDGMFEDWDDENIVSYSLPEGTTLYPLFTKMKLTGNAQYAYMYFEFKDPAQTDFFNSESGEVEKGAALDANNLPFDIFVNCDGNVETGCFIPTTDNKTAYPLYANDNMGVEWYIEGGFHFTADDTYTDFTGLTVYQFKGTDGLDCWSGGLTNVAGTYTGTEFYGQVSYDKTAGIGKAEVQFKRSFFNIKGNKASFCIKIMNGPTNWSCLGVLPQGVATDATNPESRAFVDMATVTLPTYAE